MKFILQSLLLLIVQFSFSQTTTINYTPSNQVFANPERGMYHHTETHSNNYAPLSVNQLENWRTNENITLILRIFYLDDFINSPISNSYLNNMQSDFDKIRQAGIKCVIRFAYTNNTNGAYDASKAQMLSHINQIAPYLTENSDVISVVQAGFIGVWGEWYYTDHFGINPNNTDYNNRKEIVEALLNALPNDRMVQLRTPAFKRNMYDSAPITGIQTSGSNASSINRLGHHNDCFLASETDFGTYNNVSVEYPYLEQETNYTVMGGETCAQNEPRSGCSTAVEEMELFHWSYLNIDYHPNVLSGFNNNGCLETIKKRLGYRLELKNATFPTVVSNALNINITMNNVGFASIYNPRTAYIVLRHTGTNDEYHIPINSDPRTWKATSDEININETLALPNDIIDGNYNLHLHLPDSNSDLSHRAEYAIRFANTDTWDNQTGYNDLKANITVTNEVLAVDDSSIDVQELKVYPNPTTDVLTIELNDVSEYSIALYNVVGQLVNTQNTFESSNICRFNTKHLKNGVYILKIDDGNTTITKKIMVNH
ncbi:MAG: DUF4832 domain-containing protein [Flavobacteriaceae bacterium]